MSTGGVRKISHEDIQLVQNLVERSLQLYMNEKEVLNTLLVQAKIEPCFTELVLQKLEEENRNFFKAYHLRLIVKDQITLFNRLLERHVDVMHRICPARVASTAISNGSHIPPSHQNSAGYTLDLSGHGMKSENMGQPMGSSLLNTFANGGSSLHPCMKNAIDMSAHDRRIGVAPSMMFAQSANVGIMQMSETGYGGSFSYMFGSGGNVLEALPVIGYPSVLSLSSVESNSHPLSESLLDGDGSSFGFLPQIPQIFSLPDLTADFPNSSDILNYSTSPFLAADTDNFFDPYGMCGYHGGINRMDTMSEGFSYEDFGSD